MVEPLSALSLAGTIVQFVEFALKVVSESKQGYRSVTGT